jgi:hypothetical protein
VDGVRVQTGVGTSVFFTVSDIEGDFLDVPEVDIPDYLIANPEPSWYIFLEKVLNEKMCDDLNCSEENLEKVFEIINADKEGE